MQRLIFSLIAVALLGGGVTAFLVHSYIRNATQDAAKAAAAKKSPVTVLVAKRDIPRGKKVEPADLQWLSWPQDAVSGDFVSAKRADSTKTAQFVGAIARIGILKGTPLTNVAVFHRNSPGFLAGAIESDRRAVSISVSAKSGAAGFIRPGDRVDVILVQDARRNAQQSGGGNAGNDRTFIRHTAETVLQNIRVLAVDQKIDDFDKKAKVYRTVTVEVTPKEVESLAVADSLGKLTLALRGISDEALVEEERNKKAKREAAISATGLTVTTDLEVSPVLASTVATAGGGGTKGAVRQINIYRAGNQTVVGF